MPLVPQSLIDEIFAVSASASLQGPAFREQLLAGIDPRAWGVIALTGVPLSQVQADLTWCNRNECLADGTVPLLRWLENAVKFAGALGQGPKLRDLRDRVAGHANLVGPGATIQPTAPTWPDPIPDYLSPLADRKREFNLFVRMVTGQSPQRILLLLGSSNSGKSVLLREMANYAKSLGLAHAHIDFKGCPSNDELFESLRLDLNLRPAPGTAGPARLFGVIEHLLGLSRPQVLLFDTYEQASVEAHRWVETQLFARLERCPVVAVVGGQNIPERGHSAWQALAESINLDPINRVEDWLEYTTRRWPSSVIRRAHVFAFTVACKGDPGQLAALLSTFAQAQVRAVGGGQP